MDLLDSAANQPLLLEGATDPVGFDLEGPPLLDPELTWPCPREPRPLRQRGLTGRRAVAQRSGRAGAAVQERPCGAYVQYGSTCGGVRPVPRDPERQLLGFSAYAPASSSVTLLQQMKAPSEFHGGPRPGVHTGSDRDPP